jgi:hypothetical protein
VPASALEGVKKVDIMAGVEKPHTTFTIFYHGGQATYRYGQKAWDQSDKAGGRAVQSKWVNLADSMGYVVLNLSPDPSCMVLPKPGVRDFLSLHHVENPGHNQQYITVTLPNQNHARTEAMAPKVTGAYGNGVLSCLAPPYFVCANFTDRPASIELPHGAESAGPVTASPNSVGILRLNSRTRTWRPLE